MDPPADKPSFNNLFTVTTGRVKNVSITRALINKLFKRFTSYFAIPLLVSEGAY